MAEMGLGGKTADGNAEKKKKKKKNKNKESEAPKEENKGAEEQKNQ